MHRPGCRFRRSRSSLYAEYAELMGKAVEDLCRFSHFRLNSTKNYFNPQQTDSMLTKHIIAQNRD